MAGDAPNTKDFNEVLEKGAQVDDIFKAPPSQLGSDPFDQLATPASPSEVKLESVEPEIAADVPPLFDTESVSSISRKYAAMEALFRLVTRECSFGEMASEILRISLELIKSEAGSFFELDYQNQCMFFRAVTGRSSESLLTITIPRGQGVIGFVTENQQPMTLSAVDDTIYLKTISDSVGFETRNVIAYPIIIRGVTFGCIELLNRLGEARYTDADKEVLSTICEYAAKVIENRLVIASLARGSTPSSTGEAA